MVSVKRTKTYIHSPACVIVILILILAVHLSSAFRYEEERAAAPRRDGFNRERGNVCTKASERGGRRGRKAKHTARRRLSPPVRDRVTFCYGKAIKRLLSRARRTQVAKCSLSFLSGFYHVRIYKSGTRIRDGRQIETGRRSNSRCCASPFIIHP